MSFRKPVIFPDMVRFRAETGLTSAISEAARLNRTTAGEYLRRTVRAQLASDGVNLPPMTPVRGSHASTLPNAA